MFNDQAFAPTNCAKTMVAEVSQNKGCCKTTSQRHFDFSCRDSNPCRTINAHASKNATKTMFCVIEASCVQGFSALKIVANWNFVKLRQQQLPTVFTEVSHQTSVSLVEITCVNANEVYKKTMCSDIRRLLCHGFFEKRGHGSPSQQIFVTS